MHHNVNQNLERRTPKGFVQPKGKTVWQVYIVEVKIGGQHQSQDLKDHQQIPLCHICLLSIQIVQLNYHQIDEMIGEYVWSWMSLEELIRLSMFL